MWQKVARTDGNIPHYFDRLHECPMTEVASVAGNRYLEKMIVRNSIARFFRSLLSRDVSVQE